MANYSWVVDDKTRMKKYSYDELAKPLVEQTKAHNELLDAAAEMDMQAGVLEGMLDEYKDPQTYAIYRNYIEGLKGQVDALNQRGLDYNSRANFWKYKGRYGKDIVPIQTAVNQRQEEQKQWNTLYMQNPDLMISKRPIDNSVDAYYNRSVEQPTVVNGQMIYQKAAGLAQAFAKQRLTESEQVIFDGLAYDLVQRYGTQKGFDELCKRYPELRAYKEKVMGEMGVRNLSLADQQRSSDYFDTGFNSGLSYDVKHNIHMKPQSSGGNNKDTEGFGVSIHSFGQQGEPGNTESKVYYDVEDGNGKVKTLTNEELSNPIAGGLDARMFPDNINDDETLKKFSDMIFAPVFGTSFDYQEKAMDELIEKYGDEKSKKEWEDAKKIVDTKPQGYSALPNQYLSTNPLVERKNRMEKIIKQNYQLVNNYYKNQENINKDLKNTSNYNLNNAASLNIYNGLKEFKNDNSYSQILITGNKTLETNAATQLEESLKNAARKDGLFELDDENKLTKSNLNGKDVDVTGNNISFITNNKGEMYLGITVKDGKNESKTVYYKDDQTFMSEMNETYSKIFKAISSFDNGKMKHSKSNQIDANQYNEIVNGLVLPQAIVKKFKPVTNNGLNTWYLSCPEMNDILNITEISPSVYTTTSAVDIALNNGRYLNNQVEYIAAQGIKRLYNRLQNPSK